MIRVKQAAILVGGRGTRLGSIAAHTPKPLLEIAPGVRFLDVVLDQVARYGFTDIVLLAGHLGDRVEALYHGGRLRDATVNVVREPEPAGTGGALTFAGDLLDRWFLMANGDSHFDINLRALATGPLTDSLGRLALREVPDVSRYGSVELAGDRVVAFREKSSEGSRSGLINGGVYLLNREILQHVRAPCSLELETFPLLAQAGLLTGMHFSGYFLDIGTPDSFKQAAKELPGRIVRPAAFLGRDVVLNVDIGEAPRLEGLSWVRGAREAILELNDAGYLVFVTTNDGASRGEYSEVKMTAFHARMQDELAAIGAHIDGFYLCPPHEDATIESDGAAGHPDRTPNPGMILRAMREWPVDRERSFLIGHRNSDLEIAQRAGLRGLLFQGGDLQRLTDATLIQTA